MVQKLTTEIPKQKIFKDKAIWVGTFLGGPLVAGYFLAENFKVFNDLDKVKKSWIYAIFATVLVFGIAFSLPDNINIPSQLIPLIYTGITYFLVIHLQGDKIKEHLDSGGQVHSWWTTIRVALIGLLITMLPFLGYAYFADSTANFGTETKTYGVMKHEIAFDKDNISVSEVDKIAEGLINTTYFDQALTKYIYAKKENGNYVLYLSVVDGIANDHNALAPFVQLREDMQKEFPNQKITFNLVVDYLDNVVKKLE